VQKTNLLLFITPRVLTTQEALQQMTELKKQQTLQSGANIEKKPSSLVDFLDLE